MTTLTEVLACPRCDKTPLDGRPQGYHCKACKIDFPAIAGIPWLFAEPDASLGEWRGRLHLALSQIDREVETLDSELKAPELRDTTRRRCEHYRQALVTHRQALAGLLAPVGPQSLSGSYHSYLALRTRLPADHGLTTYYANIHRDWVWGDAENRASLEQIRTVLGDDTGLGRTLILGCGAGRLAYDIHTELGPDSSVAMDFNPMLMLVAKSMFAGEALQLHEFPVAPRSIDDAAVMRTLQAPAPADDTLQLVLGDAHRPPFAAGAFDTVITPWLIDVITGDFPEFAARINTLLKKGGRWINFGSLAFASPQRSKRYSPDEVAVIVAESGFTEPRPVEATIPYMDSPASRHGRLETVCSFSATKMTRAKRTVRHRALPDWIVTGKQAVPLNESFRTQAMTTQIYAFMMSLIDGQRNIDDMAAIFEQQRLMPKNEAVHAIRGFLIKMHDDAERQAEA